MKITITYPQTVMHHKEVEISEDKLTELEEAGVYKKAEFIWENLTDEEQSSIAGGYKELCVAVEFDYSKINAKFLENE